MTLNEFIELRKKPIEEWTAEEMTKVAAFVCDPAKDHEMLEHFETAIIHRMTVGQLDDILCKAQGNGLLTDIDLIAICKHIITEAGCAGII